MQQLQLYDLPPVKQKSRREPRPEPSRTQYRREDREDQGGIDWQHWHDTGRIRYRPEPEFISEVVCPVVSPADLEGLPKKLVPHVQKFYQPLNLPDVSDEVAKAVRLTVYRLRHEAKLRLMHPGDQGPQTDFVESLTDLSRLFREEMLAARGLRAAAHGVHRVDPTDPASRWRVQPWDSNAGHLDADGIPTGSHSHYCYTDDEKLALQKLAEWWQEHRGVDIRVNPHPDSGMAELMGMIREAAAMQGERNADSIPLADALADDEDDWSYDKKMLAEHVNERLSKSLDERGIHGELRERLMRTLGF